MANEPLNAPSDAEIDASVATLMAGLPKPVQDFLAGPEREATVARLSQKYALHADQAGQFEMAFIYMLLGITKPDEFVEDMRQAGLPAETIRGLANDVNEGVFKPLLQKERAGGVAPGVQKMAAPAAPAGGQWVQVNAARPVQPAPTMPAAPFVPPVSVPESLPAIPSSLPPVLPATTPQRPPINQFLTTAPTTKPPTNLPGALPAPAHPDVRTMASDIELVKSGNFHPQNPAIPSFSTAPVDTPPRPVMPPAPATPPPPTPASSSTPRPPSTADQNRDALHAILKDYGVDPYREPIE